MTRAPDDLSSGRRLVLPNFCADRAVVTLVLIALLLSQVLAIARAGSTVILWQELARLSLFLLWIGLGSAALLCLLRGLLVRLPLAIASLLALAVVAGVIAGVSYFTRWLEPKVLAYTANANWLLSGDPWQALPGNLAIGLIITALLLRYLYIDHELALQRDLEARARGQSAQARMRSHFLLDCMNRIAKLPRTTGAQAQDTMGELSELFRTTLGEQRERSTLAQDLKVAQLYERIEVLRLRERLQVLWDVADLPADAQVPHLLLPLLLESAIAHGIEPRVEGGAVTVSGARDGHMIGITVRNPLPEFDVLVHAGHRTALENIRACLEAMYPQRALFEAGRSADEYLVRLRFPFVDGSAHAA